MKNHLFTFLLIFIFNSTFAQKPLNGLYIGVEEIYSTDETGKKTISKDSERPNHFLYYLSELKLKGDSAFLDQSSVSIYKNDTIFSASDGGFFYYSGTFTKTDTSISINLIEVFCTYCGELFEKDSNGKYNKVKRTKQYLGKITDEGIHINGFLFKISLSQKILLSENPSRFIKVPK